MGDVRSAYTCARDLPHALEVLAAAPLVPLAGGTDVYPARVGRDGHAAVLDLGRLDELRFIERDADGLHLGALTTWHDLIRTDLPRGLHGLVAAAREVGSTQIQRAGTIAGNLCNASPAADGVPPLLTLDAEVELASLAGRRRLALDEFLTGYRATARRPDELVVAVHLPSAALEHASAFVKLGSRRYLVISIAMVAVAFDLAEGRLDDVRIAVGACSPVARRLGALEAALEGAAPEGIRDRLDGVDLGLAPIDDVRGSAGYRVEVAARLVERAVEAALGGVTGIAA